MPYRFVGSYEYLKSLEMLDELAQISTPKEIEVFDKLIQDRREFSFYSGIVATIGVDNVNLAQSSRPAEFEKQYRKQSLAWLLALGRIEIAATAAMYGKTDSAFTDLAPIEFGQDEYWQMLVDDLAAHCNALSTDANLKKVTRSNARPDSETLAYLRRIKLVTDMVDSVYRFGNEEYAATAKSMESELDKYRHKLIQIASSGETTYSNTEAITSETNKIATGRTKIDPAASCKQLVERIGER